jgi:hypothetical protein
VLLDAAVLAAADAAADAVTDAAGLNRSALFEQALRHEHPRIALRNYTTKTVLRTRFGRAMAASDAHHVAIGMDVEATSGRFTHRPAVRVARR